MPRSKSRSFAGSQLDSGSLPESANACSFSKADASDATTFDKEPFGTASWHMSELTAVTDIQNQYVAVLISLGICRFPVLTIPSLYDWFFWVARVSPKRPNRRA